MTHTDNPASTSVVSSAHGDLPSFYRNRMTQVALLTKEQELEIFQRLEQSETKLRELEGNPGADAMDRDRLVKQADETRKAIAEANLRLVTSIAGKFVNSELPIHDLIQEGNIGLMTAIGKFEYRRGNKLSTYATMLIRQAIIHAIERQERTIRISGKMLGMIRKVEVVSKRLAWEYGYEPSLEEIADEIHLPVERVRKLQTMACRTISLNAPVGDSDGACFGDSLVDESAGNPMENADRLISAHRLKQVFGASDSGMARAARSEKSLVNSVSPASASAKSKPKPWRKSAASSKGVDWISLRKIRPPAIREKSLPPQGQISPLPPRL